MIRTWHNDDPITPRDIEIQMSTSHAVACAFQAVVIVIEKHHGHSQTFLDKGYKVIGGGDWEMVVGCFDALLDLF